MNERQMDPCDTQGTNETDGIKHLKNRIKELEDKLIARGFMHRAPCFICGYEGPGYYNPFIHPCAKRHHVLCKHTGDKW